MINRILHLSDTHGQHAFLTGSLPAADIVVHSGDVSFAGTEREVLDFMEWYFALPYRYKIFIAGNHDACLFGAELEGLPDRCFYLCHSTVTVENLTFYGVPMFMEEVLSGEYAGRIKSIPAGTDVLVTHQPPYGILDAAGENHYGNADLLRAVRELRPKCHLFGHVHDAYGMERIRTTIFVNGSLLDEGYDMRHRPWVLERKAGGFSVVTGRL